MRADAGIGSSTTIRGKGVGLGKYGWPLKYTCKFGSKNMSEQHTIALIDGTVDGPGSGGAHEITPSS